MADAFDAYHKWLSIPPHEQPPDHYRLLGLGLFESDPDVIQAAADRQMAHVQTYKNGPHADLSQKLLNEISAAKLCLLKPERRKAYDEQLRRTVGIAATQPAKAAKDAANGAASAPKPPGSATVVSPAFRHAADDEEEGRPNPGFATLLVGGSLAIFLLLVGIGIYLLSGRGSELASNQNGKQETGGDTKVVDPGAVPPQTVTPPVAPTPVPADNGTTNPPESINRETKVVQPAPPVQPNPSTTVTTTTTVADPTKTSELHPAKTVAPDKQPPDKNPPDKHPPDKGADKNPPDKNPPSKNTADKPAPAGDPITKPDPKQPVKIPAPDAAGLAEAEKRFAANPASGDAADLLSTAKHLSNPALVYVVLNKCVEQSAAGGDVPTAMKALDEIELRYLINMLPLRAKTLVELRRHLSSPPDFQTLANLALGLEQETVAAGRADLSLVLLETAVGAARKSSDPDLVRRATLRVIKFQQGGAVAAKEGG